MTQTVAISTALDTEECCNCGVPFAMPHALRLKRLENHEPFFCPNGHSMRYTGRTLAQLATERAETLSRRLACRDADLARERASHSATKGPAHESAKG